MLPDRDRLFVLVSGVAVALATWVVLPWVVRSWTLDADLVPGGRRVVSISANGLVIGASL